MNRLNSSLLAGLIIGLVIVFIIGCWQRHKDPAYSPPDHLRGGVDKFIGDLLGALGKGPV